VERGKHAREQYLQPIREEVLRKATLGSPVKPIGAECCPR